MHEAHFFFTSVLVKPLLPLQPLLPPHSSSSSRRLSFPFCPLSVQTGPFFGCLCQSLRPPPLPRAYFGSIECGVVFTATAAALQSRVNQSITFLNYSLSNPTRKSNPIQSHVHWATFVSFPTVPLSAPILSAVVCSLVVCGRSSSSDLRCSAI